MDKLLKEAIADAKAVRETAIANAKLALEEAFTPTIQSMVSAKIQQEVEDEDELDVEDEEEFEEQEDVEDEEEFEDEEDLEVEQDLEDEDEEEIDLDIEEDEEFEDEEEDDMDLESIIRELEDEEDEIEEQEDEEEIDLDIEDDEEEEIEEQEEEDFEDEEDEEIDLEALVRELQEDDEIEFDDEEEEDEVELESVKAELGEYRETVKYLRDKLQEVNLLNAKLLFSNKLFKGYELNESQKLSVIEQFDRARNVREVKLVFATLAESFASKPKVEIRESKGSASRAGGSTKPKKKVISEGEDLKARFQSLAGLIK